MWFTLLSKEAGNANLLVAAQSLPSRTDDLRKILVHPVVHVPGSSTSEMSKLETLVMDFIQLVEKSDIKVKASLIDLLHNMGNTRTRSKMMRIVSRGCGLDMELAELEALTLLKEAYMVIYDRHCEDRERAGVRRVSSETGKET